MSVSKIFIQISDLGFEPYQPHFVVSLSKTHLSLLSSCSPQEDPSRHNWKIIVWDEKNQIKQTNQISKFIELVEFEGSSSSWVEPVLS